MRKRDDLYLEESTKQSLNQQHKPLSLMTKLVEGLTKVDDWILDANSGIGELIVTIPCFNCYVTMSTVM